MSQFKYVIFILLFSITITLGINFSVYSKTDKLSKQHQKEEFSFIKSQISQKNQEFLKSFAEVCEEMKKFNKYALALYLKISSNEYNGDKTAHVIKKSAKHSLKKLNCSKCASTKAQNFFDNYLSNDSSADKSFDSLIRYYYKCSKIEESISNYTRQSISTSGAFHYLKIRLKLFEKSFVDDLSDVFLKSSLNYDQLAEYAKNYDLYDLKSLLLQEVAYNEQAKNLTRSGIISPMEGSNLTYTNAALLLALELIEKQLEMNQYFLLAVSERISRMPQPRKPHFADFSVSNIFIDGPDEIKTKTKVKLLVTVKNLGELSSQSSKAKITFPDNTTKIRSIPSLSLGEEFSFKINYRIKNKGNNNFTVLANFDQKALEADFSNNSTSRSLLIEE